MNYWKSIGAQYAILIGIFVVALLAWGGTAVMYKALGYTPATIILEGTAPSDVYWALKKPLSFVVLALMLLSSGVGAYILWRLEKHFRFLKGYWKAAAAVGATAIYSILGNAGAALFGLYFMGTVPALSTFHDLELI